MAPLPPAANLRHLCPPARDQGDRPPGLAFATTAAHELARNNGGSTSGRLSEDALYWGCKLLYDDIGPGTDFKSMSLNMDQRGQPEHAAWPYDLDHDDATMLSPPTSAAGAVWYRSSMSSGSSDLLDIKSSLVSGAVAIVGLELTEDFFQSSDGFVRAPTPVTKLYGGHAVLFVGFDDNAFGGAFVFRNSWGQNWGDSGYGHLAYAFAPLIYEVWTLP
jgi:hypothetical protein